MARGKIGFQKFQELISRYTFKKLEIRYLSGRNAARVLSQMAYLKVIAFGIIQGMKTLRECVARFNDYPEYHYQLGIKKKVALSTVSEAGKKRTSDFFRDLFYELLRNARGKIKRKFELAVKVLDSTTITLGDSRAVWAQFRKGKWGIKVHVLLDECLSLVESLKITAAKAADVTIAKTFEFIKGNLYVMDRAYFDTKWLYKLNEKEVFFLMRLKKNIVYVTLRETIINGSNIVAIKHIQLLGPKSEAYCDHLKLVVLRDEKTGKQIEVITNNFDLSPEEISDLYRRRWQIELFFKWLKQNLQVKRLYGRSEHAMKSQIWIAMIVYLLLWIQHHLSGPSRDTFLAFLRNFKSRLFQAEPNPRRPTESIAQMRFFFRFGWSWPPHYRTLM